MSESSLPDAVPVPISEVLTEPMNWVLDPAGPPSLDALKSTEKSGSGVDQEKSTTSTGARASDLVLGSIAPAPDQEPRPLFTILRPDRPWEPKPGCPHGSFQLDTEWLTVTCGKCGEKVEPFAALMSYATWYEEIARTARNLTWQRIDNLRAGLRAIRDRVALDETDRAEIHRACNITGKETTVENLTALLERLDAKVRDAKGSRRRA